MIRVALHDGSSLTSLHCTLQQVERAMRDSSPLLVLDCTDQHGRNCGDVLVNGRYIAVAREMK